MKYVPVVLVHCVPLAESLGLASHGSVISWEVRHEASSTKSQILDVASFNDSATLHSASAPKHKTTSNSEDTVDDSYEGFFAQTEAAYNFSQAAERLGHDDSSFEQFIRQTAHKVNGWPVVSDTNGDRVAVTFLQPATIEKLAYITRSTMHRLGPKWALQVFYGEESERENFSRALGFPTNVLWSHFVLHGNRTTQLTYNEYNWFMLSMDMWGQISEAHEHVLIFQADSLLLKGAGCVDKFLSYDYVGAPWELSIEWNPPEQGGNGGFALHRRSSRIRAMKDPRVQRFLNNGSKKIYRRSHEDLMISKVMKTMGMNLPSREEASCFCVETYKTTCAPCGMHKIWGHEWMAAATDDILASAEF